LPVHDRERRGRALDLGEREVLDDLRLMVTELVTNSVKHSGLEEGKPIVLRVRASARRVHVEVADAERGFCRETPVAYVLKPDTAGGGPPDPGATPTCRRRQGAAGEDRRIEPLHWRSRLHEPGPRSSHGEKKSGLIGRRVSDRRRAVSGFRT